VTTQASRGFAATLSSTIKRHRALACVLLVAATLVVLHVRAYTPVSPIDELQHVDYAAKASSLQLVRQGDRVGETAMREQACRTVDSPGFVSPPCEAAALEPEQFQERGFNTAAGHPPTYYFLTGVVARSLLALPAMDSFLTAARSMGVLWLAAAIALVWWAGKRLGSRDDALAGACLLLVSTQTALHLSSIVNPDAAALAAGGLVLWAALRYESAHGRGFWLVAAGAAATALKVTNVMAVLAVAVYLALRAFTGERRVGESPLRASALVVTGALVPPLAWLIVSTALAGPDAATDPMTERFRVAGIGLHELVANASALVLPTDSPFVSFLFNGPLAQLLTNVASLVYSGALLGPLLSASTGRPTVRLALATLASMFAGGPGFVLLTFVAYRAYVAVPPRYGLSLMALATVVLSCAVRTKVAARTLLAMGIVSTLAVGLSLV
jgi:4-amino-4-deoxy-L-arabinose transferase-like glycosyltransferase